jgi:TPR repeat protein
MCEASFNLGMLHMQGTEGSSDGVGKGVARDLQRARECFLLGMQQNEKNDACAVLLKEVDALIAQEKQSSVVTSDASSAMKTE